MHEYPALALDVDLELIGRLDRNGPRYTSYPTADRFVEAYSPERHASWAARRNLGGVQRALSLYVHLPFCSNVCFYCACHKVITRDAGKGEKYLRYLEREIKMQGALFRDDLRVQQMHWGGGTPTFFDAQQLRELYEVIKWHFELAPQGEYSIEVDPRTVDTEKIAALRDMGFNRMSLGVQDFNSDVQRAVNRNQSEREVRDAIEAARRAGFESINVDLIYGLPLQTLATFNRTLTRVAELSPDRIAVYNYAHLPARFKPQRRIDEKQIPAPDTKLRLLGLAAQRLKDAGYVYIGMDHFAKPGDSLAVAQRQGRLHRNFQGYSTHAECDLVGLGVSAIGAVGPTYSQNFRELADYYDCIDRGLLPIARGLELSADDLLRRSIIQSLMCQFAVSKAVVEISHLIDFDRYFATEIGELEDLAASGLLTLEDGWITVTAKGRMLIRNICMVFDKYLRHDYALKRYSRVI